jgi:NAD(P)-dependent dehydrogenase (short-subunit alcohol dehydrogenase family)
MSSDTRPVALITQCGDYVGPILAGVLARSGHRLVLHGAPDALVDQLVADGVDAIGAVGDLTTEEGNRTLVADALGTYGRLDAACFVTGFITIGPFLDTTVDDWERVKRANLDMVYWALKAALPPMIEQQRGQIVVFTSATGARPEPGVSLYASTRAGANALVRAVGLEHAADGVTVNAIGTNYMDFSGFLRATGANDPTRRAKVESQVPAKRLGTMEELAEFTAVLLDGRSRFQTGQFFSYSGGWST